MTFKSTLAGLALCAVSSAASAAPWTQTIDFNPDIYIGPAQTWTHDLTTVGFDPLSDVITNFKLTVNLTDDDSDPNGFFGSGKLEAAFANAPGLLADIVWLPTSSIGSGSSLVSSLLGLVDLNANGQLTITLSSTLGDFLLQSSVLSADGYDAPSTKVPEPGILALAGLGLLGVGLSRRKKSA